MAALRLAIAGVGNCASSLIQGLHYYQKHLEEDVPGLMHRKVGPYDVTDIQVAAAFDVDARKVGKDVSEAIFAEPNNTKVFNSNVPRSGVTVQMAPVMDGVAGHMSQYPQERRFIVARNDPVNVARAMVDANVDVLVNYLPVGSEQAVRHYAEACLEAGVAFVNCIPVFIASDEKWGERFRAAGLPIVGDDIKSQVGATITHRILAHLFEDRGVKLERTYQLNFGGNTDFLNMLAKERLATKKVSKTEAVQSVLAKPLPADRIHIGPSDYVPWLNDNKVAQIRLEGRGWGGVPLELEMRLSVEDSPNSAGSAVDAIRCAKLAMDRSLPGPLIELSAYTMKHPPVQIDDALARLLVDDWIQGKVWKALARRKFHEFREIWQERRAEREA